MPAARAAAGVKVSWLSYRGVVPAKAAERITADRPETVVSPQAVGSYDSLVPHDRKRKAVALLGSISSEKRKETKALTQASRVSRYGVGLWVSVVQEACSTTCGKDDTSPVEKRHMKAPARGALPPAPPHDSRQMPSPQQLRPAVQLALSVQRPTVNGRPLDTWSAAVTVTGPVCAASGTWTWEISRSVQRPTFVAATAGVKVTVPAAVPNRSPEIRTTVPAGPLSGSIAHNPGRSGSSVTVNDAGADSAPSLRRKTTLCAPRESGVRPRVPR